LGLALSAAGVFLFQGLAGPRPFDDAFITFRYARNLSAGLGLVYNPGQAVLGTTSPLYAALLAGLAALLGADRLPAISFTVALLADTLGVWLFYRLARAAFADSGAAGLLALAYLAHPFRLDVASGGMETSLFVAGLLLLHERYLHGGRAWALGALSAALFLLRPDAVLALLPLYAHWLWRDRRAALLAGAWAGLLAGAWLIVATWLYGSPVPHSLTAKAAVPNPAGAAAFFLMTFFATGTVGPYTRGLGWLLGGALVSLGLGLRGLRQLARQAAPLSPLALYPLVYAGAMAAVNPPLYYPWYYAPLLPGLLLLWTAGVNGPGPARLGRIGLAALGVVALPLALFAVSPNWPLSRAREPAFQAACEQVREDLQPGARVLAPDIGVLGWCLGQAVILDAAGLVSPEALPYLLPGQAVAPALVADFKPEYVIALEQFLKPALLADPGFQADYELIGQQPVTIAGAARPLYVFRRRAP
jgi:hypothetical protein